MELTELFRYVSVYFLPDVFCRGIFTLFVENPLRITLPRNALLARRSFHSSVPGP